MKRMHLATVISALMLLIPSGIYAGSATWESANDNLVNNADPSTCTGTPSNCKDVEPHVAVRATDTNTLVATYFDYSNTNCQLWRSTNGGVNWSAVANFTKQVSADPVYDAVITSTFNGNFYAVCGEDGTTNDYMLVATSTDGGATWSTGIGVGPTTNFLDKPWIAGDRSANVTTRNNVYICWTDFSDPSGSAIRFKRYIPFQTDAQAVTLATAPTGGAVQGCTIAIGAQGQVYVAWERRDGAVGSSGVINLRRNLNAGDPNNWFPALGSAARQVGAWSPHTTICQINNVNYECINGLNGITFRVNHFPSMATDSNGGVHVTWMSNSGSLTLSNARYTNSNQCISSADTCTGWGPAVKVNLDTGARDQWEPAITVSGTGGIVHITAYDRRDDANNVNYRVYGYHCHYTLPSNNCKGSDPSTQWFNDAASLAPGSTNRDGTRFIDDYHGIATSTARQAYTVWTDTRPAANDYDIYADRTTT